MLLVVTSIVLTTFIISIFARGYIPQYDNGLKITATGLLSANSLPKNASVIINDKLYTTTDDSINLVPGDYQLKIVKEGYLPWNKKITIQKEMVYQAEAALFKTNPKLTPLTTITALFPTSNPDHTQIVFIAPPSTSSYKPGIYLVESSYYFTPILSRYEPKFIATNPYSFNDKTLSFTFSPNSKQIILKSGTKRNQYLIDLTTNNISLLNEKNNLNWEQQSKEIETVNLNKLPKIFTNTVATNPASIQFSGDENKFLYLFNDQYYTYDSEKNLNYILGKRSDIINPFWLPKSNSIIYTNNGKIKSIEFDGTNNNTIFSSELYVKTIIPQFDGEKLIITSDNIYNLTIR